MRIGTQNFLLIVPLFLILAVVFGGLLYFEERQELLWGQQQEATSYAISIAEFAHERATLAHTGVDSPASDPGMRGALDRILGDQHVKTVFEIDPSTRAILWSYPKGAVISAPSDLTPQLGALMASDGTWTSGVIRIGRTGAVMDGYSSLLGPDGSHYDALGVVTDASGYVQASHETLRRVVIAAIGVSVVGLLIAVLVSWLISREVGNLSQTAAVISGGNLNVQARPGLIVEIGDLGNTFNTMSDVLKDVLSRTRRSLIEGEQFRTHAELAASYAGMFRPPISEDIGAFRIVARSTGQDFGLFWTAFESAGGSCLALGHLTAEDDVATVITASAATGYLQHRLTKADAAEAIKEVAELFKPDFFECLCFGGGTVDHWSLQPGGPIVESYPVDARVVWILHRFEPDAGSLVDQYVRVFGQRAPDDLAHDILAALPAGSEGALVIAGDKNRPVEIIEPPQEVAARR